jgi:hypothetical protein
VAKAAVLLQYFHYGYIKVHNMKISDIIPLRDGVYEMEKGVGDRKLGEGDVAKLLFGGIAAASTPQSFPENDEVL